MSEKIRKKFFCESCDYSTSDKKDWNKCKLCGDPIPPGLRMTKVCPSCLIKRPKKND